MASYLRKVAIVGASGTVGKPVLDALVKQGRHEITVITRVSSTAQFPTAPGLDIKRGNYDDDAFMQSTLQEQDVLIVMLAFQGLQQQGMIIEAAARAGVKYVLPSDFGSDYNNPKMVETVPISQEILATHVSIQKLGMKFISVVNNPWLDFALGTGMAGINIPQHQATVYADSGYFMTTTLAKVGVGVAALLALPKDTIDSDFANKFLYLSSFRLTHEELFAAVLKATGTQEQDWAVERRPVRSLLEDGGRKLATGDFGGIADLLLGANFTPGYGGDYVDEVQNQRLGLQEEDLGEVVAKIVDRL